MPDLQPFRGIRYSDEASLAELTCPPYDVISPEEQDRLHQRHSANAVRLELAKAAGGPEKYADVAQTFRGWLDDGTLKVEDEAAFYVYRQDFVDAQGVRRRVAGVLGALALEAFGSDSGVLPHERTMPGPKEDRMALLRALPVNISPIYAIYRGDGALRPLLDSLEGRPTTARFADEAGILHRLWLVTARAEQEAISGAIASRPLVIADGHHRYETALAFHEQKEGPGAHDRLMCFCVDADSEELVVLPYNRAAKAGVRQSAVKEVLTERFGGEPVSTPMEPTDLPPLLAKSSSAHPFVAVVADDAILAGVDDEQVAARTGARHPAWMALDVVALHEALFPELFGTEVPELRFSKDPLEVIRLVREEGWAVGFLLKAMAAADVVDVASSGERMPQKASYFWPKAITGLVFRSLE